MSALLLLAPAAIAVDCTADPALCAHADAIIESLDDRWPGTPFVDDAPKVKQRPQWQRARLADIKAHAEASGCTITGWAAAKRVRSDLTGDWGANGPTGPVSGSASGGIQGTYDGDASGTFGTELGARNRSGRFLADWDGSGFVAGHWVNLTSRVGFAFGLTGTCDGAYAAALQGWYGEDAGSPPVVQSLAASLSYVAGQPASFEGLSVQDSDSSTLALDVELVDAGLGELATPAVGSVVAQQATDRITLVGPVQEVAAALGQLVFHPLGPDGTDTVLRLTATDGTGTTVLEIPVDGSACPSSDGLTCDTCQTGFDTGTLEDWTLSNTCSGNVGWHVSHLTSDQGPASLYYGSMVGQENYDCGTASSGEATSPLVALAIGQPQVTFAVWLDVEDSDEYDTLGLWVLPEGEQVWDRNDLPGGSSYNTQFEFVQQTVDLSTYAGQVVQLEFRFDTVDTVANTTTGVFIDSLDIQGVCL